MSPATSRAGVHLDGHTATVAIVHGGTAPSVESTHTVAGTSHTDALEKALKLVPTTHPVRVTFTTAGVHTAAIDITAAHLTRRAFTDKARHALPDGAATSPVAGILGDLDRVADGQLQTGLALAAPGDLVDDLYRAGATHDVEVTTSAASAAFLGDGTHLCLRMDVSELFVIAGGKVTAAHQLVAPGLHELVTAAGSSDDRYRRALAGEPGDPLTAAVLGRVLDQTLGEVKALLGAQRSTLTVHGPGAEASDLLPTAAKHQLVTTPWSTPLGVNKQTTEAYCAAASVGTNTPYVTFLNRRTVSEARDARRLATRRTVGRTATAYTLAVLLAAGGPAAGAHAWALWSDHQATNAYTSALAKSSTADAVRAVQLGELRADHQFVASAIAAVSAVNADGIDIVSLRVDGPRVRVQVEGDKTDAWISSLRSLADIESVTRRGSQATVVLRPGAR